MRRLGLVFIIFLTPMAAWTTPFELHGIESLNKQEVDKFQHWIRHGLDKVEYTLGPLPQSSLPIKLKTKRIAPEPVPWGQVERGRYSVGDGLYLVVFRYAKLNNLKYDWTLYHEISHLYLPYLNSESLWLSEGFATYLQHVVLLENQIYDEQTFIKKLAAGLARGKKNSAKATGPLSDVTTNMRENRAFMRVYWTGTAFFIESELALQQQGTSLPKLVKAFNQCCRHQIETGKQLALALDKANTKSDAKNADLLFSPLFSLYQTRTDFPIISTQRLEKLAEFYQATSLLNHISRQTLSHR